MDNNNYVPSVNIIRDEQRDINYIPTPNANRIVGQISNDIRKGLRAFNIIGAYGTGKSSFLLAFEKSLRGWKPFFPMTLFDGASVGVLKIIGEYRSVVDAFADHFGLPATERTPAHVLQEIYNRYHDMGNEKPVLAIMIDEFGKFLEFAAQNDAQTDLYFIQQLAEFVGNPEWNIFILATIHQSFESYSFGLSATERQEWTKVKGRFRDITFNEPIDQLLYLAAEHITSQRKTQPSGLGLKLSYDLFKNSNLFNFSDKYAGVIYDKIFPLDIFSAHVLTMSLQRYGQNERSLFSFLESTDHTSLVRFNQAENAFYNITCVFDYLNFNFYSFLTSKYNPDFAAWSSIRSALETVERAFDDRITDVQKVIKVIGLFNVYAAGGAQITLQLLEAYCRLCVGIDDAGRLIQQLTDKKIIRFRAHSNRYVLYEGTDLDIQTALIEAANKVAAVTDVPTLLKKHFDFTPVLTKAYSFETGTPRYFKYIFSEEPVNPEFEADIDGYINLVFSDKITANDVHRFSKGVKEAIIYGYYRNAKDIKNLLYEIEKTQQVINENSDDKVARKELENILTSQQNLLNHYLLNNLYGPNGVVWSFQGKNDEIDSKKSFNRRLSQICVSTYSGTPIFRNELVNRTKLSGSVFTAKKNFFAALTANWDKPDLGFPPEKFPPEKTIYLSMLRENGLIASDLATREVRVRENSTFEALWNVCCQFLNNCKNKQVNVDELVSLLRSRPFRLKQGFIDFWVSTFLFLKKNDFALYSDEGFIPEITAEVLDMLSRNPKDYLVKAFDIDGVKLDIFNSYRVFLNQHIETRLSNQSFIETIKPFLVFYRQLPEYSKQTKRLSSDALAIKSSIASAIDPEKAFFEDFPSALGFSLSKLQENEQILQQFTIRLQSAITEIRTSYEQLLDRLESFIQNDITGVESDFEIYKAMLQKRFRGLKRHLLLPQQKTFVQRVDSGLDDRKAWLVSISQAIAGKSPENFRDDDEILFYEKLQKMVFDLDSLSKLSAIQIDEEKEEVLGIQFESFISGVKNSLIRIPKSKLAKADMLSYKIKAQLSGDNIINIAALTKLLQELIAK